MTTDYKKEFEKIFKEKIKRDGADKMLEYIKTTDFFDAPASTRFHSNHVGGLCEHSVKVYHRFVKMLECEGLYVGSGGIATATPRNDSETVSAESAAIIALLHDICKVNCYKTEMRNVKEGSTWVQKPYFAYDDPLPYGHGEKSVYMICGYMKLTREEAMCINWHMGAFDARSSDGKFTCSNAYQMFPIAAIFHSADFLTTYLDEKVTR